MTKKNILNEIEGLIEDYDRMFRKAMDDNDELRVYKYEGSLVALNILKDRIERGA